MSVGLVGAFLGGLLSLLSPCSALLLPSFFAVAFSGPRQVTARVAAFTLGLLAVLVPLGAGVGAVGSLLTVHRREATVVAGCVVIALGLLVALGGGLTVPGVDAARSRLDVRSGSWLAVLALGALYGLSGFCSGPLLGAILTVSLVGGSAVQGGALMAAYAIGMVVPLLLLALVWDRLGLGAKGWLRGRPVRIGPIHTHSTSLVTGLLLAAVGVLFVVTDGTTALPGLGDSAGQLADQQRVLDRFGTVPDAAALLVVAAVVLAGVAWRLWRG